ncbi:MAG: glycoside hydrolase family 43 [Rhodobacteraceae bacterium]|nr:glycoside hydrolase family 43 [Paracoccaceae bacterium]MAY48103.1 glycoside hydrolase family 43 [Paracoccaceae bacterium]
MQWFRKILPFAILVLVVAAIAWAVIQERSQAGLPEGIAKGNGRIEAVEIDISTKIAGRLQEIYVDEGDFVTRGQTLAQIETTQLQAQLHQAQAELRRAVIGVETAQSVVTQREAEKRAAQATLEQANVTLDLAQKTLARTTPLAKSNAVSQQALEDDEADVRGATAAAAASEAQLAAADAGISAAHASVADAEAAVEAAKAAIDAIQADLKEATLTAPRDGRVQYRVAQPGEVLASGGRVLNMVDLSDVHMTFFLPTADAGRLAIGSEARLLIDAAPGYPIPATITYVSDVAQFTPKTVETEEERNKLMFRVRARIDPELLKEYIQYVKTGVPGVAYVRVGSDAQWPADVAQVRLP